MIEKREYTGVPERMDNPGAPNNTAVRHSYKNTQKKYFNRYQKYYKGYEKNTFLLILTFLYTTAAN